MLGLVCSLTSYADHKSGDADGSEYKKNWAWRCTILAIVLGIMCIAAIAALVAVYYDDIVEFVEDKFPF